MSTIDRADLYCKSGSKDAVYHLQIEEVPGGYVVNYQNGRAGGTLASGTKSPKGPGTLELARKTFDKILREKLTAAPPYLPMAGAPGESQGSTAPPAMQSASSVFAQVGAEMQLRSTGLLPQLLNEVEPEHVEPLLVDDGWIAQQKFDGERRMVRSAKASDGSWEVVGANRKGLQVPLSLAVQEALRNQHCELDAEDIGGHLYVFDLLAVNDQDIRFMPAEHRARALAKWFELYVNAADSGMTVVPTARTPEEKRALLAQTLEKGQEGAVFKRAQAPYSSGRPSSGGDQLKLKHWSDATCLVMGMKDDKRSVQLGLRTASDASGGALVEVGYVTIPPSAAIPPVGSLVDVRYLYAYEGGSLFQPTYRGPRTDLNESAAHLGQLKFKRGHETVGAVEVAQDESISRVVERMGA